MKTLFELIKELFQLTILVLSLGLIGKIFLQHTLVGKIISVTLKEIFLFIRGCFRITKYAFKTIVKFGKTTSRTVKGINKNIKNKSNEKKVVNSNENVIDFKSAKTLRYKWNK